MLNHDDVMREAAATADKTMRKGIGGPFGAAVVKDGNIISVCSNSVLKDHDPTAHAEINAIRYAGKVLGTHDLSGCEIYATGFPCPMCMSAIIWSNINKVYFSGEPEDAAKIGFRDEFIYNYLSGSPENKNMIEFVSVDKSIATELYSNYAELEKEIY